jgi:PAS domain S-box-containing protein
MVWLPVLALALLLVAGDLLRPDGVFDPPWLLPLLNLAFLTVVPLIAGGLAVAAYCRTGVAAVLALGAAMVATALGSGILPAALQFTLGANGLVTVHNSSALAAAGWHFAAAIGGILGVSLGRNRQVHVAVAYGASAAVIFAIVWLLAVGSMPAFWEDGHATEVREVVLVTSIGLLSMAAFAWWQTFVRDRGIDFLAWYVPGLVLVALGLAAVASQTTIGGLVNWIGRAGQYLGAVYMLVAVARQTLPLGRARAGRSTLGISLLQAALPFRPLVESTADAVVALSERRRVVYWNNAARLRFGYEVDEAFDREPAELLLDAGAAPEDRARLVEILASPEALGPTGRRMVVLADRNGTRFPAELSAFASPDDTRLLVWVITDISERQRWQEDLETRVRDRTAQLEQANIELSRASHVKDEFLGLVSHELKTPVTSILAATSVLERRFAGEDGDEVFADLGAEAARLAGIIDNLLALARLDVGAPSEREPVALDRLLALSAAAVGREFPDRRIDVSAERGLIVEGIEGQLAMVVRNYLVNALKYSHAGSPVHLIAVREGCQARVSVIDEGIGLGDGDPMDLFEPFLRSAGSSMAPGMGIGLTVCKRVIESLGGRVEAANRTDRRGAVFAFVLPMLAGDEVDDRPTIGAAAR